MATIDLFDWLSKGEADRLRQFITCGLCKKLVSDPVQTANPTEEKPACGHVFCKTCILRYLEDVDPECSVCLQPLTAKQVHPDSVIARTLTLLQYTCPQCKECVKDPQSHFGTWADGCPRKCQAHRPCKKRQLETKDYDGHRLQCDQVWYRCDVCKDRVRLQQLNDHWAACYSGHVMKHQLTLTVPTGQQAGARFDRLFGSDSLNWFLSLRREDDVLVMAILLAPTKRQNHYQRSLCAIITGVKIEIYHPVTGQLLLTRIFKKHDYVESDTTDTQFTGDNVCTVSELERMGAYDAAKSLVELPVKFEVAVNRVWDPQRRPGKRQSRGVESTSVEERAEAEAPEPASSPATADPVVQVIVAQ